MKLVYPEEFIYISTPFSSSHEALDIGTEIGQTKNPDLYAGYSGIVKNVGKWYNDAGYTLEIEYDNGCKTRLCHLLKDSLVVKENQRVNQYDKVAKVGNTGTSSAEHVHYILWIDGKRVDPMKYTYVDTTKQRVAEDTKSKYGSKILYYTPTPEPQPAPKPNIGKIAELRGTVKLYRDDNTEYPTPSGRNRDCPIIDEDPNRYKIRSADFNPTDVWVQKKDVSIKGNQTQKKVLLEGTVWLYRENGTRYDVPSGKTRTCLVLSENSTMYKITSPDFNPKEVWVKKTDVKLV